MVKHSAAPLEIKADTLLSL